MLPYGCYPIPYISHVPSRLLHEGYFNGRDVYFIPLEPLGLRWVRKPQLEGNVLAELDDLRNKEDKSEFDHRQLALLEEYLPQNDNKVDSKGLRDALKQLNQTSEIDHTYLENVRLGCYCQRPDATLLDATLLDATLLDATLLDPTPPCLLSFRKRKCVISLKKNLHNSEICRAAGEASPCTSLNA